MSSPCLLWHWVGPWGTSLTDPYNLLDAEEKFEVWTDHKNLKYYREPQKLNGWQARWYLKLQDYDFMIRHILGKINTRADLLSKKDQIDVTKDNRNIEMLRQVEIWQTEVSVVLFKEGKMTQDTWLKDKNKWEKEIHDAANKICIQGKEGKKERLRYILPNFCNIYLNYQNKPLHRMMFPWYLGIIPYQGNHSATLPLNEMSRKWPHKLQAWNQPKLEQTQLSYCKHDWATENDAQQQSWPSLTGKNSR